MRRGDVEINAGNFRSSDFAEQKSLKFETPLRGGVWKTRERFQNLFAAQKRPGMGSPSSDRSYLIHPP